VVAAGLIYWKFFYVPVPDGAIRVSGSHSIALDPAEREAYVVSDRAIAIIDTSANEVTGEIPVQLDPGVEPADLERGGGAIEGALDPTIRRLVVNHWDTPGVTVIDVATRTQLKTVKISDDDDFFQAGSPVVDPQSHRAFIPYSVSGERREENRIAVVDLQTAAVAGDFATDQDVRIVPPGPIAVDPDRQLLYIPHERYNGPDNPATRIVTVADTETMNTRYDITIGTDCFYAGVAVDPNSQDVYVSCNDIQVLDPMTQTIVRKVATTPSPDAFVLLVDGSSGFGLTDDGRGASRTVWSADLGSDTSQLEVIHRGGRPQDIAYDATSRTLYIVDDDGWVLPIPLQA
jgi:DNA-binding beta-propeller fold protein YncE